MSTVDVVTVIIFAAVVLLGMALQVGLTALRARPKHLLQERLKGVQHGSGTKTSQQALQSLHRAQSDARRRRRRESLGTLGYYLNRLDTVAGHQGARYLGLFVVAVAVLGLVLFISGALPRAWWVLLIAVLLLPLLLALLVYQALVQRFNKKFMNQMPDAIDMIVRASQAGIPVTQSIRNVGVQYEAPLGPEFLRMGDSLLLGADLHDVLDTAVKRVELPDFTFFSVCVLLQRESGGSIAEALENLSGIIRARRDLGLKTRALTAEGRLSGNVLAAIPFVLIGGLYYLSPQYLDALITTETGHKLLWVAGILLVVGIFSIRKLANLKV